MATPMQAGMRGGLATALEVGRTIVTLGPATTAMAATLVLAYGLEVAVAPPAGITSEFLIWCGGNEPSLVMDGQVWRLLSYSFLHASLFHLAMNVVPLFVVGALVNREFGSGRFLAMHLLGVAAGGLALCLLGGHDIVSVGASGGLFALAGALVVLALRDHPWTSRRTLLVDLPLMAGTSLVPGVDWRTHAGGFVTGLALALFWTRGDWSPSFTKSKD